MTVTFYFDPSCPFCWITSRWLLMVAGERDILIDWQPFSLAIKNDELGGTGKTEHGDLHRVAHRVLRVMQAARDQGTALIDLYTDFGTAYHLGGEAFDDALIERVLAQHQLAPELAQAADNTEWDRSLRASVDSATAIAGQDIGVPTIVFTTADGHQTGFFGPVLQTLPDRTEALQLWDGLSLLATDPNFYELKRTRPTGSPDVFSTARC